MELLPNQQESARHLFDCFCKKVLREEACNYERHIAWRAKHEVSLSELPEEQLNQIYILDEHPSDSMQFVVCGYRITVHDDRLARALCSLTDDKRDILLLAYFLDLTDKEIADTLNTVRSTIQYKRTSSLKEMKQRMEVQKDGNQSEA